MLAPSHSPTPVSGAEYGEGVGERAYPQIATFPKFEYVTPEEISADENADKDAVEVLRAKLARKHEAQAVSEFQERLDFNMKRVGMQIMHTKPHPFLPSMSRVLIHLMPQSAGSSFQVGKTLDRRRRRKSEVHAGTGNAKILIKPLGRTTEVKPWVAVPGANMLLRADLTSSGLSCRVSPDFPALRLAWLWHR